MIPNSYWSQRTRWKMSERAKITRNGTLVRGRPNGEILSVFRRDGSWAWCIKRDGLARFSERSYRTRKEAKAAVVKEVYRDA